MISHPFRQIYKISPINSTGVRMSERTGVSGGVTGPAADRIGYKYLIRFQMLILCRRQF